MSDTTTTHESVFAKICAWFENLFSAAETELVDVSNGTGVWRIVLGIAEEAIVVDPALGAVVTAASAIVEPILAEIGTDATATAARVSTITTTANALLVQVAPSISAVPNVTAANATAAG